MLLLSGMLSAAPGSADTAGPNEAPRFTTAAGPVSQQAMKRTPGNLGGSSDLFVEGELLVQFKKGVKRGVSSAVHAANGGARALDTIRGLGGRIEHVKLAPGLSVATAVRSYEKDPNVAIVEPNFRYQWMSHDDPTNLWGLENDGVTAHLISDPPPPNAVGTLDADIDAHAAWATQTGTSSTVVAVIDSGVQHTHGDLDGNRWINPGEGAVPDGVDNDGNGCIDDIYGRAFGYPCADLTDVADHGTHVAGTIAAEDDGAGITGVCPGCRFMTLKFDLTTASEVAAYAYARQKGAEVINGSFGGPVWSKISYNAVKQLNNAGIVAVYAAANDQLDNDLALAHPGGGLSPAFPGSYNLPNIISVAASNHHDEYGYFTGCASPSQGVAKRFCSFSNVGRESVDLAAPGVDIRSTIPVNTWDVYNGTSMAAPHVAGVAGLVRSEFPALNPVQVKNKIMNGADKNLPTMNTFFASIFKGGKANGKFTRTSGRLNAAGALAAGTANATPKTDGDIPGAKKIAQTKKGRVAYPNDVNDVYKKKLKKGKRYRATLTVGKKDFDLWIWAPKTTQVWQFEPGCFGGGKCPVVAAGFAPKGKNEVITFRAKKSGFHYFQVVAWLKMKGGYKLTIRPV